MSSGETGEGTLSGVSTDWGRLDSSSWSLESSKKVLPGENIIEGSSGARELDWPSKGMSSGETGEGTLSGVPTDWGRLDSSSWSLESSKEVLPGENIIEGSSGARELDWPSLSGPAGWGPGLAVVASREWAPGENLDGTLSGASDCGKLEGSDCWPSLLSSMEVLPGENIDGSSSGAKELDWPSLESSFKSGKLGGSSSDSSGAGEIWYGKKSGAPTERLKGVSSWTVEVQLEVGLLAAWEGRGGKGNGFQGLLDCRKRLRVGWEGKAGLPESSGTVCLLWS